MTHIAIVDDETEFQDELRGYLERFASECGEKIQVSVFDDGIDIISEYAGNWDIIFLDIKMKHMDGMETARKIRELDSGVVLIFITTMARYAIKGYEVDAMDFVLKPLNYVQLSTKLKKAMKFVKRQSGERYLLLPAGEKKERVSSGDILCIEVQGHSMRVVTAKKAYDLRYSMADMEKTLAGCHFARCNQSYLVNLKHVTGVGRETVRVEEYELPISRPKRKQFLKEVSDYLEEGY